MRFNPKIALIGATCILLSTFLVSYKTFQVFQREACTEKTEHIEQLAQFVGQEIDQRLLQMEAAVSYLDKSTIETLKRMGARYFVYSFKKQGEWTYKWKVLSALGKEEILKEVSVLNLNAFSEKTRHWAKTEKGELIFLTPVQLANSHQLKEGFLIFGMNKNFFSSLKDKEATHILVNGEGLALYGDLPQGMEASDFIGENQPISGFEPIDPNNIKITSFSFSPISQLWVLRSQEEALLAYTESSAFTYFLIIVAIALLFMLVAFTSLLKDGLSVTTFIQLPKFNLLKVPLIKPKNIEVEEESPFISSDPEVVNNFADFLDEVLAEDRQRLSQLGIRLTTQVVDEAQVKISKKHVADFIQRLVGNSALSLEGEEEKEIQLQLVEQKDSFQLIYVDTRSENFPTHQETSLMAQTEGSLEGIDGVISYARWMFGSSLTVAKKGFCLSIDMPKNIEKPVVQEVVVPELMAAQEEGAEARIEITEQDTDMDLIDGFVSLDSIAGLESEEEDDEPSVSFDDVIDQFRMKEFSFAESKPVEESEASVEETIEVVDTQEEAPAVVETDDKGFFELESGDFKIKIRSPKKRDLNVDR